MEKTWLSRAINSAHLVNMVASNTLQSAQPIFEAADQCLSTQFRPKSVTANDYQITMSNLSPLPKEVVVALRERCGVGAVPQGRLLSSIKLGKYTYYTFSKSAANSYWTFILDGSVEFGRVDTIFSHRQNVGGVQKTRLWFGMSVFSTASNPMVEQWPRLGISLRSQSLSNTVVVAPEEMMDRVAVIPLQAHLDAYISIPW